jgi:hypothetical protein
MRRQAPRGASSGRDDQLGTLNFLTPERRAAAATLVKRGAVFNLDLPLHLPAQPFFESRTRPTHTIERWSNGTVQDDYLNGMHIGLQLHPDRGADAVLSAPALQPS